MPTMPRSALHRPAAALAALVALAVAGVAAAAAPNRLRFKADGSFKIIMLTDLHYGDSNSTLDALTDGVQRTVLATEPDIDLAVLNGDQVTAFYWMSNLTAGWYEEHWRRLSRPVLESGLPFAVNLGNHDGEADLTRREVVQLAMRASERSLTKLGPQGLTGAANYWLDVYDAAGEEVAARVWVLDSGNMVCEGLSGWWGCVGSRTLEWVKSTAAHLPRVPSLAFIHIPVPQLVDAYNHFPTVGQKNEGVTCPEAADPGVFAALKDIGLQALYFGHDHASDYAGEINGVRLAYGRKTGYGTYFSLPGRLHGARLIELRAGESAARSQTWIRNERGEREDQEPTAAEEKAVHGRQRFCLYDEDKNQLMQQECKQGLQSGPFCEKYAGGLWDAASQLDDTILNGTAVTVLLPVVTQLPEFVRAAAHQRVFSPKQAAAELRSYTLPLGRAAITTTLELARLRATTTAAGSLAAFELEPEANDVYARLEQADGSFRRYRVLPYFSVSADGKSIAFPLQKTVDEADPTPDFVERVLAAAGSGASAAASADDHLGKGDASAVLQSGLEAAALLS